jgi:hypothetical protein
MSTRFLKAEKGAFRSIPLILVVGFRFNQVSWIEDEHRGHREDKVRATERILVEKRILDGDYVMYVQHLLFHHLKHSSLCGPPAILCALCVHLNPALSALSP